MKTLATCAGVLISSVGLIGEGNSQWPLGREPSQPSKANESPTSVMVTGRYQVFVSPLIKSHTFMIDTDSGRVWIFKKDSTSGDFSLQRIPVEDVDGPQSEKSVPKKWGSGEKEPRR